MTLVPYRQSHPYDASSVFYRGDSATRFQQVRTLPGDIDTIVYYPGIARLTTEPVLAATGNLGAKIRADAVLANPNASNYCGPKGIIRAGLLLEGIQSDEEGYPVADTLNPGLPPSFFATPNSGGVAVDTLVETEKIARTSVFTPFGLFVPLKRYFIGHDSLLAWLNTQPYDSALGSLADIRVHLEMVRASDSVVLWRGDTLSARTMADSSAEYAASIPLSGVFPGTRVFIRQKTVTTAGLNYDLSAGFHFVDADDEESEGPVEKRSLPRPYGGHRSSIRIHVVR